MRDEDLGRVLIVRAFEEQDREGTILPTADRESAAREAARNVGTPPAEEGLLAERARLLYARIVARHPVVESVRSLAGGLAPIEMLLVLAGLVAGFGLSALDGTRRIEIISLPLIGLLAWNLLVYVLLLVGTIRSRGPMASGRLLPMAIAKIPSAFATRIIDRARNFDTTLASALGRFLRMWFEVAMPLNRARAARGLHLGAMAVGVGLIAGLYVRGLVLDYQAGWESTFLSAERVRAMLAFLYGPAAWLVALPLPDAAHLETIRWRAGASGGEPAARWIHLVAVTTLLFVVVPRAVLAIAAAARAWGLRTGMPLPADLHAYFRSAFASVESIVPRSVALVMPYAHVLDDAASERLVAWLTANTDSKVDVDIAAPLPYGEEERYLATLAERGADRADIVVLPFGLATTPEDENHGAVVQGVRDWLAARRPQARLMIVIDESGYKARMSAAPERLAERRALWRAFVEARGAKPEFIDLAA